VITSFVSKFGTILLQLLSIPLALRVLGREEFGLYTTVNLTLVAISLLQAGVGPALTHGLSKARAAADETRQRELGSTAFFLMAGTGVIEYNFCGWLVGRVGGPSAVALHGIFITLTVMQLGFVVMLSTPTWPAVAEALARGDRPG
jgi:O-antigen/teichoic acid export membrane protein